MPARFPKIGFKFLRSAEFKARQLWLDFGDAVGTVLQTLEPVKAAAWEWFRQWKAGFVTKAIDKGLPYQKDTTFPLS